MKFLKIMPMIFPSMLPLTDVPKLRWIWDSVPVQLAKKNNKFVFSHVKEGKRSAELEDALQWLVDAGLLIKTELAKKPEIPMESAANKTYFKVYMSDVGLLRAKSKVTVNTMLEESDLFEVKSADNTQAKSYKLFCKKYQPKKGIKSSRKNALTNAILCATNIVHSSTHIMIAIRRHDSCREK
jgi:hypothetical protein